MAKHAAIKGKKDVFWLDPHLIKIRPGWNPRKDLGDLTELKDSIKEEGVIVPINVKRDASSSGDFYVLNGHRRLAATLLAIKEGADPRIPAMISKKEMSDPNALILSILTNGDKPLTPVEEGGAFARLIKWGLTIADIMKKTGRSVYYVTSRLALIEAAPEIQTAVENKEVTIKAAVSAVKSSAGNLKTQKQKNIKTFNAQKVFNVFEKQLKFSGDTTFTEDDKKILADLRSNIQDLLDSIG